MCVCEVRERERETESVFMILQLDLYLCVGGVEMSLMVTMIGQLGLLVLSLILVEIVDSRDNMQIKAPKCFPSQYRQSYPVIWQSHLHYKLSS